MTSRTSSRSSTDEAISRSSSPQPRPNSERSWFPSASGSSQSRIMRTSCTPPCKRIPPATRVCQRSSSESARSQNSVEIGVLRRRWRLALKDQRLRAVVDDHALEWWKEVEPEHGDLRRIADREDRHLREDGAAHVELVHRQLRREHRLVAPARR